VEVNARVAALLELGAGFQPDFSGIDNVKMKASLLGMSSRQLDQKMDEILAFADIGDYVYEPVKHYSSGMVVRLGFAVVAASAPELLITDEVLAVGDESFQKKCIRWIETFLESGNTLLMVSHSMFLVQKLCQKALWVHEGKARKMGDVFAVTQSYLAYHEEKSGLEKSQRDSRKGTEGLYQVKEFRVLNEPTGDELVIGHGEDLTAELILFSPDGRPPVALVGVMRADGTPVYGVASDFDGISPVIVDSQHFRYRIRFKKLKLLPGNYTIRGHAMDPEGMRLCDTTEIRFSVSGQSREMGFIHLPHDWNGEG
jgi:lipopolysaccharide transport system ATP-binding protein